MTAIPQYIESIRKVARSETAAGSFAPVALDDLEMDFSRQQMSKETLAALLDFATERDIPARRDAMMAGEIVNKSENRPATHTRMRDAGHPAARGNVDAMSAAMDSLMTEGVEDVVSLGIGGSELGPALAVSALRPFHQGPAVHFVSNIDPTHLDDCLEGLDPATTGFIVISKTFGTLETLANLGVARNWLEAGGVKATERMVAVTANTANAAKQGFDEARILPMDEGVGGRLSLWSAVGLPAMMALGREGFIDMLAGANSMDNHFADAEGADNLPLMGGLLRFLNIAVLERPAHAILPYEQRLNGLPGWATQLEMESNGKSLDENGKAVASMTAPVIFGAVGNPAQHSFFQMLFEGTLTVPVDFLCARAPLGVADEATAFDRHRALFTGMVAAADALAESGRPSVVYTWDETTPYSLGRLLALYEHITAVYGWLLGLNSFDQPGVEHAKKMGGRYRKWLDGDDGVELSQSARHLLGRFRGES